MSKFKNQYRAYYDGKGVSVAEIEVLSKVSVKGEIRCKRHAACGFMALVPQDYLSATPEHALTVFIADKRNSLDAIDANAANKKEMYTMLIKQAELTKSKL